MTHGHVHSQSEGYQLAGDVREAAETLDAEVQAGRSRAIEPWLAQVTRRKCSTEHNAFRWIWTRHTEPWETMRVLAAQAAPK